MIWLAFILFVGLSEVTHSDPLENPHKSLFGNPQNHSKISSIVKRSVKSEQNQKSSGVLSLPIPLQFVRPCTTDNGLQPCFTSGIIERDGYQIDYYAGISAVLKKSDYANGKSNTKQQYLNLPIPMEYIPKCNLENGLKPCIHVGEWHKENLIVCYYMGIAKVSQCSENAKNRVKREVSEKSSLENILRDMILKAPSPKSKNQ